MAEEFDRFLFVDELITNVYFLRFELLQQIKSLREIEQKLKETYSELIVEMQIYTENSLSLDDNEKSNYLTSLHEKMHKCLKDSQERSIVIRTTNDMISACVRTVQSEYDRIVPLSPEQMPYSSLVKSLLMKIQRDQPEDKLKEEYIRTRNFDDKISDNDIEGVYCWCRRNASVGDMIGCDGENCEYEWFHLKCVGLENEAPKTGNWYCSECSKTL